MNPRKCFFANLMVLTKQDNLREVMNLGKVEEKIEKKIHLLKTLTWMSQKNYKGVICYNNSQRYRTCWKIQYYHRTRSKCTLMVVKFCFVCWI